MERMSESERSELWDRWEVGESQRSIARALERSPSTVRTQLLSSGWQRPVPASEWCSLGLSLGEREETIAQSESLRSIAQRLSRSSTTQAVQSESSPDACRGRREAVRHWSTGRRHRTIDVEEWVSETDSSRSIQHD